MSREPALPRIVYATPRALPKLDLLQGRVVVLDIAFAADGMGTPFDETTGKWIKALGPRLAAWVDHHDHERHKDFASDARFTLATKAEHGACPEMVTPAIVTAAGPYDTIVAHSDLDGIYSVAKWILDGSEPYAGSDDDARAVDTRMSEPGPIGMLIDKALRAHWKDIPLRQRVVKFLIGKLRDREHRAVIEKAAADFDAMATEAMRLAGGFERRGRAVVVDASDARGPYDKTLLLLEGQKQAAVSVVRDGGNLTAAAAFDSGIDFVKLLTLGGGMPTRISIPDARLEELLTKLNA